MIKRIAVIGAGTMGTGIAFVTAKKGYRVTVIDQKSGQLKKSKNKIVTILDKDIKKSKISEEDKETILNNLTFKETIDNTQVNMVIEAVFEDVAVKKNLLKKLDESLGEEVILASNTSGISITDLAGAVKNPKRIIGTHFFNPVTHMPLVEVVKGYHTDEETISQVMTFIKGIGKTPILVPRDSPGFIVNRILLPYLNEAVVLYAEGVDPKDVDTAMKLGAGFPMGPLELLDLIGIDIFLNTADHFVEEFKDAKYRPPVILRQMVRAECLGRKTGEGFYKYN